MNHIASRKIRTSSLLGTLLLTAVLAWPYLVNGEESCDSEKCHAKLLKGATEHPVASICDNCHESVSTPHPKRGEKTFKLSQDQPELCTGCHEVFGSKKSFHEPVKAGTCTVCHDPHASEQPKLLRKPMRELCGSCHKDHVEAKHLHGPVAAGACTACHNPHESDNKKLLLKAEEQELCVECHLDMPEVLKKKVVHPALENGCTACHNPHGGDYPKLLSAEGTELCGQCHPDVTDTAEKAPAPHAAVDLGCETCHSPHASDNPHLLLEPEKATCVNCHEGVITDAMKTFHGPINEGHCTACHNPHGGQYPKLLAKPFSDDLYVPYTGTEFPLCFSCHKRDMIAYPDTSFATNFRNGERNLHYLHVNNKQKGRGCVLCHNLHGSAGPRLVADSVPFGKWNLPLKFEATETGGSCAPGCHRPQSYDRKNPVKRGEAKEKSAAGD